jgi:hypothetical protein
MKKITSLLFSVLVLSSLAAGCTGSQMDLDLTPLIQTDQNQAQADPLLATRTISVTGNAEVRVVPDQVIVTLGIESFDKNLEAAKTQNDRVIRKAFEIVEDLGIDAKDVQTDYISIEPRYDTNFNKQTLLGYAVRKTMAVTLRDISKFDALLSNMIAGGVNYVHGIDFRTTELRKYRDQARALALKAAQEKAIAMAGELDQEVGEPIAIREEYSNWWSGYSSWWGYGMGSQSQNVIQNSQGVQPDSENAVALGLIAVNASVSVEFRLK